MADTRWTWTQLIALLPDNAAGGIDAQEIRDLAYTVLPVMSGMYISSSAETTISDTNWTKALGTTTSFLADGFSMPANNRLTYGGTAARRCVILAALSTETAAANKTFEYGIYHYDDSGASGVVLTHSPIQRYHSNADIGAVPVIGIATLETSDYVELHIKNTSDTVNGTVDRMCMAVIGWPVAP